MSSETNHSIGVNSNGSAGRQNKDAELGKKAVENSSVKDAKISVPCISDLKTLSDSNVSLVGFKSITNETLDLPSVSRDKDTTPTSTSAEKACSEKLSLSEEDSSENTDSVDSSACCREKNENAPVQSQSCRPKSVSFHTGSSLPLERKISNALDCLRYMMNGSSLIKVRASSRQYRRFFSLEEDLSALKWIPSSKKSSKARLPIRCMKEVRMGKSTEVLRSKEISGNYSEDCAFSIIYNDNFESLDIIASTPDEANIWVTGLNVLIGASKCMM